MKYTIFLFAFLFCQFLANVGCDNQQLQSKVSNVIQMDSMINNILSRHPNYATNDIVMEAAENEFIEKFTSIYKDVNYIDDFDFDLFRIANNPNGEGYIIHLNKLEENNQINVTGDIICMTTDTILAKSIDKTKKYRVKTCKLSALLTTDMLKFISINWEKKSYNTPDIYLKNGVIGVNANFGVMLCLFAEVIPAPTI